MQHSHKRHVTNNLSPEKKKSKTDLSLGSKGILLILQNPFFFFFDDK